MQELKQKKIWLCWNYEEKKGKKTKVPCSVSGVHIGTNEEYEGMWVTFEEAQRAKAENNYAGIGFVIPKGYFFIDIDHKPLTDPFVKLMIDRFNSYTEYSPSGTGIHIYGKCEYEQIPKITEKNGKTKLDPAFYLKNPNNDTEQYIGGLTNRFATYTENAILAEPLKECTAAVLITLDKDMRKKEKKRYSEKRDGDDGECFDIVANLRKQKNGEKFSQLYDRGDISGYGTQSEADAALCALIAFRAGPNPNAIDNVFRTSALYREKWEREDYRASTIQCGIDACHGKFHRSKMPYPPFIRFNEMTGEPYVAVVPLANYVREHLNYLLVRDNGKQGVLTYVYENGCYRLYAQDMMLGIIKQYVADYDEELVKMNQIRSVYEHITTDLAYVRQDELNANEDIINFQNGLLCLKDYGGELIPHTPSVLSTIQIPCKWTGKNSPTPVFDAYIKTLADNDKAVIRLLMEFVGACLSNVKGWRMKKALFLVGKGDTGKSQLKSLVERLLGKGNFIGIDLKEIEARFGTGMVYGTRLAGSSDMSFLSVDELKTFKKFTGGDSLFAEFKGQQGFEYTYNGLLWFCMNRLPKFGGDDGQWVYDRIMVVNCPNVIPKNEQDKHLLDKMYAERDGIVYKAIYAYRQVIQNGYRFTEPPSVMVARREYRETNSTVIGFFEECMCKRLVGRTWDSCTTGKIFKVYKAWCADNNNGFSKTYREFREILAEHLGTTFPEMVVKRNSGSYYKDYTLTLETKKSYAQVYGYDDISPL